MPEILYEAQQLVGGPRQDTYGHPADDYARVIDIFYALTGVSVTIEQALLFMVSVKLARLRTNIDAGGWHHDSLVDAIGYLACLDMAHKKISGI